MAGKHSVDQYAEAKAPKGSTKKRLDRLSIQKGKNGGHVVTHHYVSDAGVYHPSEDHIFGPNDGAKMLSHVKSQLSVGDNDGDE